ncbi:MAG: hypothetical protein HGGPFJEG_02643 [Ignavibacteria bacterium]|nr:hypothetical protein [Ignavibacteria bacterium]
MKKIIYILIFTALFVGSLQSQTWLQRLNGRGVWSLAKDNNGNIFAGGLTGGNSRIYKSTDGGDNWDTIHIGAGQTMWDFSFDQSGTMYVANYSTGLLKSTNGGINFTLIPPSVFNFKNLQGVECGSNGYIYVTTSTGFMRSTDNGTTFTETGLSGLNCLPLLIDIDSANIIYVGVTGASSVGFYRSTDYGQTFSVNLNPGLNGYNIVQANDGAVYMVTTTSPYLFSKSLNKGLTWTFPSNLPSAQRGITYSISGNIFTSGNGGVHRSTNSGSSFTNYNFSTTATPILSVKRNSDLLLFAGTTGASAGGVWKCIEGTAPVINLDLKMTAEGLYNVPSNTLNRKDTVKLYLRESVPPYRLRDSSSGVIDSVSFSNVFTFTNTISGVYYLVVKHHNTIETWSKNGGENLITDGIINNYDFTDVQSKAYGNNLILKGSKYCIYSGDVTQEGIIDGSDLSLIDNDASNFVTGYVPTDIDGNYFVDASDASITDNNAAAFIQTIRP